MNAYNIKHLTMVEKKEDRCGRMPGGVEGKLRGRMSEKRPWTVLSYQADDLGGVLYLFMLYFLRLQ